MAARKEKCNREVKMHWPASLYFAVLQAAAEDDRKMSQFVRHVLAKEPSVKKFLHALNATVSLASPIGDYAGKIRGRKNYNDSPRRRG